MHVFLSTQNQIIYNEENGYLKEGAFSINYTFGYFSKKDGMKHCFDFKGKTPRGEFFMCTLSFAFVGGFLRICESLIWMFVFDLPPENAAKTSVFALLGTIAFYSMSCRRLRDAGYSEKALRWITFPFGPAIAFFVSLTPNEIKVKK